MTIENNSAARGEEVALPVGTSNCATAAIRVRAPRALAFCVHHWRQLRAAIADPYRPERHYMRGPGPKWQATHRANAATR